MDAETKERLEEALRPLLPQQIMVDAALESIAKAGLVVSMPLPECDVNCDDPMCPYTHT